MKRAFWRWWGHEGLTDEDRAALVEAEQELVHRKKRGAAVHAEVTHIVERNNLAEKFHTALTLKKKDRHGVA